MTVVMFMICKCPSFLLELLVFFLVQIDHAIGELFYLLFYTVFRGVAPVRVMSKPTSSHDIGTHVS